MSLGLRPLNQIKQEVKLGEAASWAGFAVSTFYYAAISLALRSRGKAPVCVLTGAPKGATGASPN